MGFDAPDSVHALPASEGGGGYPARLCAALLSANASGLSKRDFRRPAGVRLALLDSVALEEDKAVRLSTEKTPARYTVRELFHEYDLPVLFSTNWTLPDPVTDFRLLSGPDETPVVSFTVRKAHTQYVLTRADADGTKEIAVLEGEPGQELRYADTDHDWRQPAVYALLPRNALLFEEGVLLAGPQPSRVQYAPGGLLNAIMGVGGDDATPPPTEIDVSPDQSLFT